MNKKLLLIIIIAFFGMQYSLAQKRLITGTVISSDDGKPLTGATILVKGTTLATATDVNGKYILSVPASARILVFQFLGMKSQEIAIGDKSLIDVKLQADALNLESVVVTAIGIKRETKALGYSVQELGNDDINKTNDANLLNSLNGKVAGVNVTSGSGAAGGSSFMTIRGDASITGNNQPLFVVDGVPIDNSQYYSGNPDNGSNNLTEGVAYSNRAIDINPEDIESVSVLKGGAATALYGLRAANGVVLISTKKGSVTGGNKVNVTFSSSFSLDQVNKLPQMQNKFAQGRGGVWKGPETSNRYSWGPSLDSCRYSNGPLSPDQDVNGDGVYDWDKNGIIVKSDQPNNGKSVTPYDNLKKFFQNGFQINNNLGVSGGNQDATYYFSLSNMKQNGVVPKNDFEKTSVKISGEAKLSSELSTSGSVNYINSGGNRLQQGNNMSGIMLGLLRTPCTFDNSNGLSDPVGNSASYMFPDGTQRSFRGYGIYDNPFWSVNQNQFKDDVNRIIGNFQFTYIPSEWITVTYRLGNDFYSDRRKGHYAIYSSQNVSGQVMEDQHFNRDINSDLIATLKKDFNKDFKSTLMLGNNMFQNYHQQLYVEGDELNVPDFYQLSNSTSQISREEVDKKRTAAFYGDFGISYKSLLFLDITGRNEWSTTLPQNNNSFFFPSASLGFVFTELPAISNNAILPFGKLRLSIADIANDAAIYGTKTYYSQAFFNDGWTHGITYPIMGTAGYSVDDILGNPDLKPEKLQSFEVGTDLKFIGNRAELDFTYYNNKNKDEILEVPLAGSSGYVAKLMNAGTMQNQGIEVVLKGTPVKTKDFEWELTFNFTRNRNKVVSLANGVENVGLGGFTGAEIRAVVGKPYGEIYGTQWLRNSDGKMIIDDDPNSSNYGYPILSDKEADLGTVQPNFTLDMTNQFKYKQWALSFLWDWKNGGHMWNGTKGIMYALGTHKDTENRGKKTTFDGVPGHLDSNGNVVLGTGSNTTVVVLNEDWYSGLGGGFDGPTEEFIERTDWLRLREVTLTYTLDPKYLKKTIFSSLDVYFSGRNLLLFTPYSGVDPETSLYGADNAQGLDYFNMPNTRSYVFGLRVTL